MNVIVTGGAGFIGSHLVEKLLQIKKIKKIIVIDCFKNSSIINLKKILKNKKIFLVKKNICDKKQILKYFKNCKIVFHLAAIADIVPSIQKPLEYINNNFIGTLNVLECMREHKVKKIIYAASASCYGLTKKFPTNEVEKIDTAYPYAFSKYTSELAVIHWSKVYRIKYISLRLFNVYGLRSRTTGAYGAVMGVFLKQKLSNKPFTVVGDGKQLRDFINVKDVAEAFYKAGFSNVSNKIFNVGTSKPQSVNRLVSLLKGKSVKIPKRPGEPNKSQAEIKKIKKYLNWQPRISFKDGVEELKKNIIYWKTAPLWTSKKISEATKEWFKYLK
jgi:UDP-glucose 4-epimerase|tara:strand:- start:2176 stop:3165 length:990 start_codon:yes stop_codon:yes gene_type:complete